MRKNTPRQYTIRNVPDQVDSVLRQRAKALGKSFNQVVLEALASGTGGFAAPKRDLGDITGSLTEEEALHMDEEVRLQRQIDPTLWR